MDTSFQSKCDILSELWLNYREDKDFQDFIKYNDISLPLAFMIAEGIIENPGELAEGFIDETFNLLLKAAGVSDLGFQTLDDILKDIEDNGM